MEPVPTPYEELGGDPVVRAIVTRFYHRMDTLPEASGIRAMHAEDLSEAREKLFDFLCGWLGGPQRYVEKHGHPRLRARHLPFRIATPEAEAWMLCMRGALEDEVSDAALRTQVERALERLAGHMRNTEDR
jgi:hemoglobin